MLIVSQSHGRPISVATKNGLRSARGDPLGPSVDVAWAGRPGVFRSCRAGQLLPLASCASGVDHAIATDLKVGAPAFGLVRSGSLPRLAMLAAGVGHVVNAAIVRSGSAARLRLQGPSPFASVATGVAHLACASARTARAVGHKPPSFAFVRGANGRCGEQTPFRIEPVVGKVTEDSGKSSEPNKSGDVFQQDDARSHLADDLEAFGPEPVFAVNSGPQPG